MTRKDKIFRASLVLGGISFLLYSISAFGPVWFRRDGVIVLMVASAIVGVVQITLIFYVPRLKRWMPVVGALFALLLAGFYLFVKSFRGSYTW